MKKLLLAAALAAITTTTAHAATWWTSTKNDAGWNCVRDGTSPASRFQWLRNQGFSPLVSDYGGTVVVEEGPGGGGYFYFRNVQACWRGINLAHPG
jgi:opacity protein-like surface antigen